MTETKRTGTLRDERGVVLVICLLLITLLYVLGATMLNISTTESSMASGRGDVMRSFYLADAGIEHARRSLQGKDLSEVLDGTTTVFETSNSANLAGGSYTIQVTNNILANGFPLDTIPADPSALDTIDSDDIVVLTSTATFENATQVVEAVVGMPPTALPPGVRGAATTNGPTETNGTIIIDGRDHDLDGNVIPGYGTYGVFAADNYAQNGDSTVGGTDTDSNDFAPAKPGDPLVIEENYSGTMAATADEVMGGAGSGYPEGTLKTMAQTGTNGSQYVTDPSSLTYPLSGVTYVEVPCGDTWNPANIDGSGILVVHNSCTDAVIKNLNSGTFKGLLIADDIVHIHTDIIGAVVSLIPAPSSGNAIGNGSGQVLYSRQALANAVGGGTATNAYSILSWRQL